MLSLRLPLSILASALLRRYLLGRLIFQQITVLVTTSGGGLSTETSNLLSRFAHTEKKTTTVEKGDPLPVDAEKRRLRGVRLVLLRGVHRHAHLHEGLQRRADARDA